MQYTSYDVLLQTTGSFLGSLAELQQKPPIKSLQLATDLSIGRLPEIIQRDVLMDACEPAGYNFRPVRQYGYRYSFIRSLMSDEYPSYSWDEDGYLGKVLFLSRLIHPTTASGQYSARVILEDNKLESIIPGRTGGLGSQVWIVAEEWRDWLTLEEGEVLRRSLPTYLANSPPERVRRGRRHLDEAFHSFYLDQRIASLVTGFESLLKVSRYGATKQFSSRVPALAAEVGEVISQEAAECFYDDRSIFVHGAEPAWKELEAELIDTYQLFERTLRAALLRASLDEAFAKLFENAETIENTFTTK